MPEQGKGWDRGVGSEISVEECVPWCGGRVIGGGEQVREERELPDGRRILGVGRGGGGGTLLGRRVISVGKGGLRV